jgi:hypothetical protein
MVCITFQPTPKLNDSQQGLAVQNELEMTVLPIAKRPSHAAARKKMQAAMNKLDHKRSLPNGIGTHNNKAVKPKYISLSPNQKPLL